MREQTLSLGADGLFLCSVDDPALVSDPALLKQNANRLQFYERYGVRPIINNDYASPSRAGDEDVYYLMYDALGKETPLRNAMVQRIVRTILTRKYGHLFNEQYIDILAQTFRDDPVLLRPPKYVRRLSKAAVVPHQPAQTIALIVNEGLSVHRVKDRRHVEAPVRVSVILRELKRPACSRISNHKGLPNG